MPLLHGVLPGLSRAALFVYYRIRYTGQPVPPRGPVLLVANHPNSLLDPAMVVAAAQRPVRFLAKAPLFSDPKTAFLVKGAAAIPVYRRSDDPGLMDRNEDAFRAVYTALAQGAAVGIFPEGLSHSEPALAPLKTGAARMALGGAREAGRPFPVVPIGLVFRHKAVFRSEAVTLVGEPVSWDDLAARGPEDADAVRELTERIADSLRRVTVNLERWQDQPLVEFILKLWDAEGRIAEDEAARLARLETTAGILAEARRRDDREALALADAVNAQRRRLARLGLDPDDLRADVGLSRALRWTARRIHWTLPFAALAAVAGFAAFYVPYRATGMIVDRRKLKHDEQSTWKLLLGIVIYGLWIIGLSVAAAAIWDWWMGLITLAALPIVGMTGLAVRERFRGAWDDARRFFLLRSRRHLVASLLAEQTRLAARLRALHDRYTAGMETR